MILGDLLKILGTLLQKMMYLDVKRHIYQKRIESQKEIIKMQ